MGLLVTMSDEELLDAALQSLAAEISEQVERRYTRVMLSMTASERVELSPRLGADVGGVGAFSLDDAPPLAPPVLPLRTEREIDL